MALTLLEWAALIALCAAGAVVLVRALPFVQEWVFRGIKPWACDICMSFWATLGATVAAYVVEPGFVPLVAAGPAYALTLGALRVITAPRSDFPPLEADSDGNDDAEPTSPATPHRAHKR